MKTYVKTIEEIKGLSIKSKQMFSGNFDEYLNKLIEGAEILIREKIIPEYRTEYTEFGNYTVKIKIKDPSQMLDKLIVCNFYYDNKDIKYGYIHPEFTCSEKGNKTKKYQLGKFDISETERILDIFIKKMVDIIEEY